jgi:hypothetical protein
VPREQCEKQYLPPSLLISARHQAMKQLSSTVREEELNPACDKVGFSPLF